jgi:hypothetical protein
MKVHFKSLTYPDLKLTNGKTVNATFQKGVFETENEAVIAFLRKCVECKEYKPEPIEKAPNLPEKIESKPEKAPHIGKPEPGPHTTPNPHKAGA